jgi:hypothetical protein
MSAIDDVRQLWQEVLERSRRTQPALQQRSLSIIKPLVDPTYLQEELFVETTAYPTTAQWAIPPTWNPTVNTKWGEGSKWGSGVSGFSSGFSSGFH